MPRIVLPLTILTLALIVAARRIVAILVAAIAVAALAIVALAIVALMIVALMVVPLIAGLFARPDRFTLGAEVVVAVVIVSIVERIVRLLATRLTVLEPAALFAQHTEIMIRELEVIFDVDAVTRLLCIAGEVLVLLVQLRRIAACPTVDAVAVVATLATALTRIATAPAAAATIVVATTTATAAGLPVIDQACVLVLKTNPVLLRNPLRKPPTARRCRRIRSATATGLQRHREEGCGPAP